MPQPDFSYIRLSHSLAEPLQRKKKNWDFFFQYSSLSLFMLQQHGLWLHQNFLLNVLWLSCFSFSYLFHTAASLWHLNWLESWVARQYISRWNWFSWNLFFHFICSMLFIFIFQSPNSTHVTEMYLSPYKCSCWEVTPSLYLGIALPFIQPSPHWLPSLPALGKQGRSVCLLICCEPKQASWGLWFLQNFSPDLSCWSLWIQHIWNKMLGQLSFWPNINVVNYFKWS